MAQLAPESVDRIVSFVRGGNSTKVTIGDAMALANLMAESFDGVFKAVDDEVHKEFREIATAISDMRGEIGRLQANDMTGVRIPTAGRELDAIVDATEAATNTIMESAEALLAADTGDDVDAYKELVEGHCLQIFEACSFQDITGQRVSKVVETLKHIEERIVHFAESTGAEDDTGPMSEDERDREARKAKLILHGPQLDGDGVGQDTIDAMLDGVDAAEPKTASQGEIDSLFD